MWTLAAMIMLGNEKIKDVEHCGAVHGGGIHGNASPTAFFVTLGPICHDD
jgi:hypothetical protein